MHDIQTVLTRWLRTHVAGGADVVIREMTRPKSGFSAHTLLLKVDVKLGDRWIEHQWVIRLEQSGRNLFLDTDIGRQAQVMRQLASRDIRVPAILGVEKDRSLLGGQFLVMKRVDGHSLPQHPSYQIAGLLYDLPPSLRGALWGDALTTIARINRINWRDGFEFLDMPSYGMSGLDQYLGWLAAWKQMATNGEPHPVIDAAMDYLLREKPAAPPVDVLWGDSNPGNILFSDDGRVAAVHDFEASALGPGEIDLAWWFFIDEMLSLGTSRLEGIPDRAAEIAIYEKALGRPVANLAYYDVLAGVRICLVVVRSAQLFIKEGRIPSTSRAGFDNPIVAMLARRLGMPNDVTTDDYMTLVMAMNQR